MFGLGSRNGIKKMKSILDKVQSQLTADGMDQQLHMYQTGFVHNTKTFVEYGETFESEGYTAVGGLAKYCHNVFVKALEPIQKGMLPMPLVVDLAEKMAFVAVSIDRVISEDDMRDKDKIMVASAMKMAHEWLTCDKRVELVKKVDDILLSLENEISNDGIIGAMRNGEKYLQRLTAW